MKKINILFICGAVFLCGCASNVVPMGRDTFMVSHRGSSWSTVSSLKIECLKDANKYCQKKGLAMVPISTGGHDGGWGIVGSCELMFLAVPPNDSRNTPQRWDRSPDNVQKIIIEQK